MPLRCRISEDNLWHYTSNTEVRYKTALSIDDGSRVDYSPFKLHISIAPNHLHTVKTTLERILDEACLDLRIPSYKKFIFIFGNFSPRATHWSYTVYLHDTYSPSNAIDIAKLCRNIQDLLTNNHIPVGDHARLYACDLPVLPNIIFRCSTLDLNAPDDKLTYCGATRNTRPEHIQTMKRLGETSEFYRDIQAALTTEVKLEKKAEAKLEVKAEAKAAVPAPAINLVRAAPASVAAAKIPGPFNLFFGDFPQRDPIMPAALNLNIQSKKN